MEKEKTRRRSIVLACSCAVRFGVAICLWSSRQGDEWQGKARDWSSRDRAGAQLFPGFVSVRAFVQAKAAKNQADQLVPSF